MDSRRPLPCPAQATAGSSALHRSKAQLSQPQEEWDAVLAPRSPVLPWPGL